MPPAGIVTGLGRFTVIRSGETPVQAAERPTLELKPFTDENTIVVDCVVDGASVIAAEVGCVRKSAPGEEAMATDPDPPKGVTVKSSVAVCETPIGLVPITVNGYVPVGVEVLT